MSTKQQMKQSQAATSLYGRSRNLGRRIERCLAKLPLEVTPDLVDALRLAIRWELDKAALKDASNDG